jgi:hypothetical protein
MLPDYAHSLGGKKTALKNRKNALDNYYKNPKYCQNCGKIIEVKDGQKISEVRVKKFCDHKCASTFNNSKRKIVKYKKKTRFELSLDKWKERTKKDLFENSKDYFSARSTITKCAQRAIKYSRRERCCENCGYNKHVEVCHIKAVAQFHESSSLYEINNENNLILLCPNCHWEFDNNILKIQVREAAISPSS